MSLDDFRTTVAIIQIVEVNIDALVVALRCYMNKLIERLSAAAALCCARYWSRNGWRWCPLLFTCQPFTNATQPIKIFRAKARLDGEWFCLFENVLCIVIRISVGFRAAREASTLSQLLAEELFKLSHGMSGFDLQELLVKDLITVVVLA